MTSPTADGVTKNKTWDNVIPMPEMWQAFKRVIKPRGAIVLTATQPFASQLIMSNFEYFRYELIWAKNKPTQHLNANQRPMPIHENILVFSLLPATVCSNPMVYYPQKTKSKPKQLGKAKPDNTSNYGKFTPIPHISDETYPNSILHFASGIDDALHPTQKPLALWQYLIKTYTQEGDTVLDPCVGSGTTAVACHLLNRHYICGDTSAEYIAIAKERVANCDPLQAKVIGAFKQPSLFEQL